MVAVFDWEMSALGDPLVDLGILLGVLVADGAAAAARRADDGDGSPGYLSKDEIVERYAARSGRDVTAVRCYEIFALFKIAVVIQQIFYRYKRGQTDDVGLPISASASNIWRARPGRWRKFRSSESRH